jgi:O-methyltransferase involved in polyketide biosynthesis
MRVNDAHFAQLNQRAEQIAVISEGLLIYLDEEKVTALAADLYAQPHFTYWLVEVISPRVLAWINRKWQRHFQGANALMRFAPGNWRSFYSDRGWEVVEFRDVAKTARGLNREPRMMKVFRVMGQMFPALSQKRDQAWESGIALLRRSGAISRETKRK